MGQRIRWGWGVCLALVTGCHGLAAWQSVSTVAGGARGDLDGPGDQARFSWPMGIAYAKGALFVTDVRNHAIRRVDADGRVTTLAGGHEGFADGTGARARLAYPRDVAADAAGNLYVADATNHRIRKVTPEGVVTTVAGTGRRGHADGPALRATFHSPWGIAVGPDGTVFVADTGNHSIRRIGRDGRVTTLAGAGVAGCADGVGRRARFYLPRDVAVTPGGSVLVADAGNHRVRRILSDGRTITLAGSAGFGYVDGPADTAQLGYLTGIAVDADGAALVVDETHQCLRRVTPNGTVSTVAGRGQEGCQDGPSRFATFRWPANVAVGPAGYYLADAGNYRIRRITLR